MKRVVYRSTSNIGADNVGMLDIIRACDRNNQPAEITGLLWFDGRFFLHAIEGPSDAVDALFLKLRGDDRHHSIHVTDQRRIETRRHKDFSVRFHHGFPAFDPIACGISRTNVGPMLIAKADAGATSFYPISLGQAATRPH